MGGADTNVTGAVTVTPGPDGKPKVSLDCQANVGDRYNWDVNQEKQSRRSRTRERRSMKSTSGPPTPSAPPVRGTLKQWLLALAMLLVLAAAGVTALVLLTKHTAGKGARQEATCCWDEHASPNSVGGRIGIRTPASATDQHAGVKRNSRYTTAVLAFTLPTKDAQAYLGQLIPKGTSMVTPERPDGTAPPEPDSTFRHLGLPEPSTPGPHSDVSTVSLCPKSLGGDSLDIALKHCVDIYQRPGPSEQTWLYFRSMVAGD